MSKQETPRKSKWREAKDRELLDLIEQIPPDRRGLALRALFDLMRQWGGLDERLRRLRQTLSPAAYDFMIREYFPERLQEIEQPGAAR